MKIKISEIFYSVQGEGRYVGVPSVFLRTFGCNFTCAGFGCAPGEKSVVADDIATEHKANPFSKFETLPLATTGCDSYASWHPGFRDLSASYDTGEIVDRMLTLTPNHCWLQDNGNPVHLVITGGEPLLGWQRAYPELLDHLRMDDLRHVTFETNGTQLLSAEFRQYLNNWRGRGEITFSVSPKLSVSGEAREEAIRPEVVSEYETVGITYLKFVVASMTDFDELDQAVIDYRRAGFAGPVFVMPVGGVHEVYDANRVNVANEALKRGYWYSPRLHVDIWGNSWGT
jgi:organic radical activating enzyme